MIYSLNDNRVIIILIIAYRLSNICKPPGSFAVARDLHRIVISALTMDPGPRTFVPRPKKQENHEIT